MGSSVSYGQNLGNYSGQSLGSCGSYTAGTLGTVGTITTTSTYPFVGKIKTYTRAFQFYPIRSNTTVVDDSETFDAQVNSLKDELRQQMKSDGFISLEDRWDVHADQPTPIWDSVLDSGYGYILYGEGRECNRSEIVDKTQCRKCKKKFICLTKGKEEYVLPVQTGGTGVSISSGGTIFSNVVSDSTILGTVIDTDSNGTATIQVT